MIIPLSKIEPSGFGRWATVEAYAAMLHQSKKAPPILVIKQNGKFPYRVHDGAHRVEAAKLARRVNIKAELFAEDV
jgi:ParB-like nuclease domain